MCATTWPPSIHPIFQMLPNRSSTTAAFWYMWEAVSREKGLSPFKKYQTWLIPWNASLHVWKHPTHTGSIKRFVTCCHSSIAWILILPRMHHVPFLIGSAIPTFLPMLLSTYFTSIIIRTAHCATALRARRARANYVMHNVTTSWYNVGNGVQRLYSVGSLTFHRVELQT